MNVTGCVISLGFRVAASGLKNLSRLTENSDSIFLCLNVLHQILQPIGLFGGDCGPVLRSQRLRRMTGAEGAMVNAQRMATGRL